MTWIKVAEIPPDNEHLVRARSFYPATYVQPVDPSAGPEAGIVMSHSLIPQALEHAFSTFGALLSPKLPLSRRQHEMIATVVSVYNRCVY